MFEVDPETYRYFFSASAQVFAAIFAVVAIAYGYRLTDLQRKYDEIQKEKVGKVFTYKSLIDGNYLRELIGGSGKIQPLLDNIFNLDNATIEAMLCAIVKRCDFLIGIASGNSIPNHRLTVEKCNYIKKLIQRTLEGSGRINKSLKIAKRAVIIPAILAAAMTIYSLLMLSILTFIFETCLSITVISCSVILFALSLAFITVRFILLFLQ